MAFRPTIPAYSTQGKSFSRTAAFPLEGYEIWTDLEALKAYAANTDASKDPSYIGQKVAYVDYEGNRVVHYGIEIDGTLKELGADKMGVEALTAADHGKIPKAFYVVDTPASGEEDAEDYQPEVGHVEVRWVTPESFEDTNTVTTIGADDASLYFDLHEDDVDKKTYTAKVNISAEEGNSLSLKADGLYVEVPEIPEVVHPEYAVRKEEKDGYHGVYHLTKDGTDVDVAIEVPETDLFEYTKTKDLTDYTVTVSTENVEDTNFKHYVFTQCKKEIAHIDIPKDLVVSSGEVVVATEADKTNDANVIVGETYIKLVVANQTKPLYIAAKDLVDVYTGDNTDSAEVTVSADNKITAKVKISAKEGNSLEIIETDGEEGLYVNAPVLPTSEDTVVANQYVTAVDQKDGKITVSRKQISYTELTDLPTIPGETDFGVLSLTGENAIEVTGDQEKVVKLLVDETNKGNVTLTQSEAGLKAEVDLSEYAKTAEIPDVVIAAATDKTYADTAPVTDKVIMALTANEHTITPTALEVVTKAGWDKINNAGEGQTAVRLISQSEIDKLAKLNLDNGEITISGSVNASQVKELYDTVVNIVKGSTSDLDPDTEGDQLGLGIEKGAQVNLIESIGLPDATLAIADKHVAIPAFLAGKYGVIKGAELDSDSKPVANLVYANNGVGEVRKVSTDILENGEFELVLNGGNADLTKA